MDTSDSIGFDILQYISFKLKNNFCMHKNIKLWLNFLNIKTYNGNSWRKLSIATNKSSTFTLCISPLEFDIATHLSVVKKEYMDRVVVCNHTYRDTHACDSLWCFRSNTRLLAMWYLCLVILWRTNYNFLISVKYSGLYLEYTT